MRSVKRVLFVVVAIAALAAVVHAYSLEGVDGLLFSRMMAEDTIYASGYSDGAFRKVHRSMTEAEVMRLLPPPIEEVWSYGEHGALMASVQFAGNVVHSVQTDGMPRLSVVRAGMTKAQVSAAAGAPPAKDFIYTRSRNDSNYHLRIVALRYGRITDRISEFYVD
jgi:hypothetical protein